MWLLPGGIIYLLLRTGFGPLHRRSLAQWCRWWKNSFLGRALSEQGVTSHVLSVGGDSNFMDYWEPFSDEQRMISGFLTRTYDRFKWVVSKGRRMSLEAVESVAQGRVWTGVQALEAGLVDELGGLDACLADLATRLGSSESRMNVIHFRTAPRGWRKWRKRLIGTEFHNIETRFIHRVPLMLQSIHASPHQALVLLPFDVDGQ